MNEILTGTTTPGQSGPGSNGNERVCHTLQISRIGPSPSNAVWCHISVGDTAYFKHPWQGDNLKALKLMVKSFETISVITFTYSLIDN